MNPHNYKRNYEQMINYANVMNNDYYNINNDNEYNTFNDSTIDNDHENDTNTYFQNKNNHNDIRRSVRKKRKTAFQGDVDCIYNDCEVVWAKLEDFPWWPA